MLFGYREVVDNRIATLVAAAETSVEFDNFLSLTRNQDNRNFNEIYVSNALQHLMEDLYSGFKRKVVLFYHDDDKQRSDFILEWNIQEVGPNRARDCQVHMIAMDKMLDEESNKSESSELTIAEQLGLDVYDPWDKRSEEEKESDRKIKEMMKELQKEGKISSDSFDHPSTSTDVKTVSVDRIDIESKDGVMSISGIKATKLTDEVDEGLRINRQKLNEIKKNFTFTAEDFAEALRGDGSSDHIGISGDHEVRRGLKKYEPVFSPEATKAREEYKKHRLKDNE